MNKFHKIFAGLFAALALTAFVATGAMAQDTDTDNQQVTVDSEDILLLDISTANDTSDVTNTVASPTSGDEQDTIAFSWDSSDFDTAGIGIGGPNDQGKSPIHGAALQVTTSTNAELTLCNQSDFGTFGQGTDSQSNMHVATWAGGNSGNDIMTSDAQYGTDGDQYYVVGNGDVDPEANSGAGQGPNDCPDSAVMGTFEPGAQSPSNGLGVNYTAWYDPADGDISGDSAELKWTLVATN